MTRVQRALQALACVLLADSAHATKPACPAGQWGYSAQFGEGRMQMFDYASELNEIVEYTGKVTWATQLPGGKLALCNEPENKVSIFSPDTKSFVDVTLGALTGPVGAVVFENKVWVACFGAGGKSGIAVVNPDTGKLEATHEFPLVGGQVSFVHNIYAFTIEGKTEIYVASLGNPWAEIVVRGHGMVKFDRANNAFVLATTERSGTLSVQLNARSLVQQSDDVFYMLEQIFGSAKAPVLTRLERHGQIFKPAKEAFLPTRDSGDGGADVFMGPELNSVFVTDRGAYGGNAASGKLYYYQFDRPGHEGLFHKAGEWETGNHPRHTTTRSNGDIIACNQDENTISVFEGLAKNPSEKNPSVRKEQAVPKVSFFLEVCVGQTTDPSNDANLFGVPLIVIGVIAIGIIIAVAVFAGRDDAQMQKHSSSGSSSSKTPLPVVELS